MSPREIPISLDRLVEESRVEEVYNIGLYLDSESGEVLSVPSDLIEYCQGETEGMDPQLSDSHDLPAAQAIAEEIMWIQQGFDEEGLPYGEEDRRFFSLPRLGERPEEECRQAVEQWLERWDLQTTE